MRSDRPDAMAARSRLELQDILGSLQSIFGFPVNDTLKQERKNLSTIKTSVDLGFASLDHGLVTQVRSIGGVGTVVVAQ